jgi:hypothetical protein
MGAVAKALLDFNEEISLSKLFAGGFKPFRAV